MPAMVQREGNGTIVDTDRLLILPAGVATETRNQLRLKPSMNDSPASVADDIDADLSNTPIPRLRFTTPAPPEVNFVGSTDASLDWQPVELAEVDPPLSEDAAGIEYTLEHVLEYQEVKTLRPGRKYIFRLRCVPTVSNDDVEVEPIQPSASTELTTTPTPPHALQPPSLAVRARNALKLKWSLPDETGGLPILHYTLFMRPPPPGHEGLPDGQGFVAVYEGEERSHRVAGLRPGMRFTFRVQAANELGLSPLSLCSVFTTQASVPGIITTPEETGRTVSSVSFRWQPPEDNGSPVASYTLELDDGTQDGGGFRLAYAGTAPLCTVPNLKSGLTYRFRLRADNEEGRGQWCVPFTAGTSATTPSSPLPPIVVGVNRTSATLSWTPPEDDGGSVVQLYELELLPKSSVAQQQLGREWLVVFRGPNTAHTVPTLLPGCSYMCRVRAINEAGAGQHSAAVEVQAAADVPHTPAPPKATAVQTHSTTLEWRAPEHDGGAPVSSYRLEMALTHPASSDLHPSTSYDPQDIDDPVFCCVYSGPECAAQVVDLLPGTHYLFRIAAVNSQGGSCWSYPTLTATRAAPPLPPAAPRVAATSCSAVAISWAAPECQGAQVASYQVEAAVVRAEANGNASSTASEAAGDDGGPRLHYVLVYKGAATQCEAKGLEPYTEYAFRVRASNSVGPGSWSAESRTRTQPAAPGAPTCLEAAGTSSSSIVLSWRPPLLDNGAEVTSYLVESAAAPRLKGAAAATAPVWQRAWQGPQCTCSVSALKPGRRYMFRVKAVNSRGIGAASGEATATTAASPPAAPEAVVVVQKAASSVRVKWTFPAQDNGAPVELCVLQMAGVDGVFHVVYTGTETSYRAQGLQPQTRYTFRVAALNEAGRGPYSDEAAATTSLLPPPPPQDVDVVVVFEAGGDGQDDGGGYAAMAAAVEVRWDPPVASPQCAKVLMYEVEVAVAEGEGEQRAWKQTGGHDGMCRLGGLPTGTALAVRMRSVGLEGVGHSAWTEPIKVLTPGPKMTALARARNEGDDAAASNAGRRLAKGRGKLRSSDSDDGSSVGAGPGPASQGARLLSVGSTAAKPPKKGPSKFQRDVKRFAACVAAALLALHLARLIWEESGMSWSFIQQVLQYVGAISLIIGVLIGSRYLWLVHGHVWIHARQRMYARVRQSWCGRGWEALCQRFRRSKPAGKVAAVPVHAKRSRRGRG